MTKPTTYFYQKIPINYEASPQQYEDILAQFPVPTLPNGDEGIDLSSELKGNRIKARVLLSEYKVQTTKTNKQFLKMSFNNNKGVIPAKMWDNNGAVDKNLPILENNAIFDISGVVDEFKGYKSLTINNLTPCEEDVSPFSLLPYTSVDMLELTVELISYVNELDSPFRKLSYALLNRFWDQFAIRPAAKGFHHNYLGGLLKHTVGLMRFARYILKEEENHFQAVLKLINIVEKAYKQELWGQFQSDETTKPVWKDTIDHLYHMFTGMMEHKDETPNTDILLTSILFHDIGKLLEYDHAGKTYDTFEFLYPTARQDSLHKRKQAGIAMDELGVMVGHIPYGVLLLTKMIEVEEIPLSLEAIHAMSHCILCHHGLPEWGSCVRKPQTIEGFLTHIVDYLDSRYENVVTEK